MGLAPHVELLLACAGATPQARLDETRPAEGSHLRSKFEVCSSKLFGVLVAHHGLAPHVHGVLAASGDVPADALVELEGMHRRTSEHNLLLTARLLQVLEAFERAGIRVVTLKGPALAQQLYGDPGMRDSLDLDLLVRPADVAAAAALLEAQGYRLESELGWLGMADLARRCTELTFRSASGTAVDLHWASAPADFPSAIPEHRLWTSVTSVSIAGRSVPVLSAECLLVYLCIHGTRHYWTKLAWLCDIAMIGKQSRSCERSAMRPAIDEARLDWPLVHEIAAEARATRALHLGLQLAHELLGADLPADVLSRVTADRALDPFAADVTRRLVSPDPAPQPSSVERTMFNARLAMGRWRRVRHVAALLKAPTDADAGVVRLPRPFVFLYYPLRAARLAAKYGRALVAG